MNDYSKILNSVRCPVRISFEPTINCNLKCPMCDRTVKKDYVKHLNDKLPYETALKFIHEVGTLGIRCFLFIGGGEPLTDPHTIEYMKILKSYGVYVHLWTNGTLIDENNAPLLSEYCNMITVSLDSVDPEKNDKSRGVSGATQKTIKALKLLRQNSDTIYLRIHSVISALNIDDLKDSADFAYENKINEIGGALLAPFDFIPDNMEFSKEQIKNLCVKIEQFSEYSKTKGIALAGCFANISAKIIENLDHIHKMYYPRQAEKSEHITCMGLWGQATVRPNGDVSVCCFTYKPVLGNLHENTFYEIWNSDKAQKLRELVKKGEYIDAPCIGCDTGHPVFTRELEYSGSIDSYLEMSINAR